MRLKRGTNAIEFALTAPVLFLSIFGIFECGWYLCQQVTLNEIVNDLARVTSYSSQETIDDDFNAAKLNALNSWDNLPFPGTPNFSYEIMSNNNQPLTIEINSSVEYISLSPFKIFNDDLLESSTIMSWQGEWQ